MLYLIDEMLRELDALNLMHFFTVFGGKEYDRNEAIQQIKERRGAGGTYYDMAQRPRQY